MLSSQTNRKNIDDEGRFYQDLDEKRSHQSCCTCYTLSFLFFGILLVAVSGVFYLYYQMKGEKVFPNLAQAGSLADLNLQMKNLKPNALGQVEIPITDSELTMLLSEGFSLQDFIIKDVKTSINEKNILIYGVLTKPISSKVVMTAVPVAANGKVNFEITNTTAGKLNLPGILNQKISDNFADVLSAKLAFVYQRMDVKQVVLNNGKITIIGNIK